MPISVISLISLISQIGLIRLVVPAAKCLCFAMILPKLSAVFLLASFLGPAFALRGQTPYALDCAKVAGRQGNDSDRLRELFKLDWDYTMRENPEFATQVGYPGQNDRWTDASLEAIERQKRELRAPLKVLQTIIRDKLSAADQLNYDLFKRNHEEAIEGTRFKGEDLPITQLGG